LADSVSVNGNELRPDRQVLPKRQDMNRDKIDGVVKFAIAQPYLLGIGIGNRGSGIVTICRTGYALIKASRSALIVAASVVGMPCGKPL